MRLLSEASPMRLSRMRLEGVLAEHPPERALEVLERGLASLRRRAAVDRQPKAARGLVKQEAPPCSSLPATGSKLPVHSNGRVHQNRLAAAAPESAAEIIDLCLEDSDEGDPDMRPTDTQKAQDVPADAMDGIKEGVPLTGTCGDKTVSALAVESPPCILKGQGTADRGRDATSATLAGAAAPSLCAVLTRNDVMPLVRNDKALSVEASCLDMLLLCVDAGGGTNQNGALEAQTAPTDSTAELQEPAGKQGQPVSVPERQKLSHTGNGNDQGHGSTAGGAVLGLGGSMLPAKPGTSAPVAVNVVKRVNIQKGNKRQLRAIRCQTESLPVQGDMAPSDPLPDSLAAQGDGRLEAAVQSLTRKRQPDGAATEPNENGKRAAIEELPGETDVAAAIAARAGLRTMKLRDLVAKLVRA